VDKVDKQAIDEKLGAIIKENCKFNSDQIQFDLDLRDNYGIDSIVLVEMLVAIEAAFDITIDSNLLTYDCFSTMGKITDYLYQQLNPGVTVG
jgi:acyl carrier protein